MEKPLEAYIWEYLENWRNYPGYHFTAQPDACEVLTKLVRDLAGGRATQTIGLARLAPADEKKITGGQRFRGFDQLILEYDPDLKDPLVIHPDRSKRQIRLQLNVLGADELLGLLSEVRQGRGDTSIAVIDPTATMKRYRLSRLWYWPCFGHMHPKG